MVGAMGLLCCSPGEDRGARLGTEALATGPAHVNATWLLWVEAGAGANRARRDKERASGHADTSAQHLWKITEPERQVQPEHGGQHLRK